MLFDKLAAALLLAAVPAAPQARAAETLQVGAVGAANAVVWPHYIAEAKGFYADQGLSIDLYYSDSSPGTLQALTGGSTKIAIAVGLSDPTHAVLRGANLAIVRIDGQVGPYALLANKEIHSIKDLKSKKVSVDAATGTTMVYFDIMATKNGMTRKDFDYIFAGATAARFAALEAGATDAAMLTAPQLFTAQANGFVDIGDVYTYAPDVPFTSEVVSRDWAGANKATVKKYLTAYGNAIAWFYDTKNRAEAIQILLKVTKMNEDDIAKSYDLFQKINYFDKSDKVSMKKMEGYIKAQERVDGPISIDPKKMVLEIE
jgi:NitT/TauT family transport system substrate-binding protein